MIKKNLLGIKRQKKENSENDDYSICAPHIDKISKGIINYYLFLNTYKEKIDSLLLFLVDKKFINELIKKYLDVLNKNYKSSKDQQKCIQLIKTGLLKEKKISKIKPPKTNYFNNFKYYNNYKFMNKESMEYFLDGFGLDKNYNNFPKVIVRFNGNTYCIEYDKNLVDFQFTNSQGNIIKRYILEFSSKNIGNSFITKTLNQGISYIEAYIQNNKNYKEQINKNEELYFIKVLTIEKEEQKEESTLYQNKYRLEDKNKSKDINDDTLINFNKNIRYNLKKYCEGNRLYESLLNYYCFENDLNLMINNHYNKNVLEVYLVDKEWIQNFKDIYKYDIIKKFCQNNLDIFDTNNKIEIFFNNYIKEIKKNIILNDIFEPLKFCREKTINENEINIKYFIDFDYIDSETFQNFKHFFQVNENSREIKCQIIILNNNITIIDYNNKTTFQIIKTSNNKEIIENYLIISKSNIEVLKKIFFENKFEECFSKLNIVNRFNAKNVTILNNNTIGEIYNIITINNFSDNKNKNKKYSAININNYNNINNFKNNYSNINNNVNNYSNINNYNNNYSNINNNVNNYSNFNNYNNNYINNYDNNYNNIKNYNNVNNYSKNNVNNYSNINNFSYINNYINFNNNNYSNINNYNFNNYINEELSNNAIINKNFKKESILNKQSFIGLDNIGATCYMNASLQCMNNVFELTKFILKNNLNTINTNKKKLSLAYQEVIKNLWPKDNNYLNNTSYSPYNFKKIISEMNPLFKGIQANDSKDLILFLLETMHTELNQKKYNIKNNINQNQISIYDFNTAFNIFSTHYINNYNSVISNIFYGAECHTTKCFSCNAITYNIQCFNILIFPLEKVRLFKRFNQNQPITIADCFECHRNPELFFGENQIYCNNCNLNSNASTQNFFVYGPNVLIINLNRGKGIQFNVKLNFELYLDISNYVCNNNGPKKYELIGVVQHYGESSMNGHYIAFCKSKFDKNWYKYNDSIVQKVNYNEMYSSGIPYVLFYHKL